MMNVNVPAISEEDRLMQKAKDIMTRRPATCTTRQFIYDAVQLMAEEDCGVIPIVDDDNHCIGIVTDRDICLEVVLNRQDPQSTPLTKVMTHDITTCREEDTLCEAIRKMEQKKVRRIPVLDDDGRCTGIISESDIALKDDNHTQVAALINAISH